MSLEQSIDRLSTVLEKLLVVASAASGAAVTPPAEAPKETKPKKGAKVTAEEKKNATDAEPAGKATQVPPDDLLEKTPEAKKLTDVDVRKALQDYAATFPEKEGTKAARALMVKLVESKNPDMKLGELAADKFAVVVEGAEKATAERKKAAAEAL